MGYDGGEIYEHILDVGLSIFHRLCIGLDSGAVMAELDHAQSKMGQPRLLHRAVFADIWLWPVRSVLAGIPGELPADYGSLLE